MAQNIDDLNKYILTSIKDGSIVKEKGLEILAHLNQPRTKTHDDIAITGVACKLPKAGNPEKYWENIRDKVNCIGDFPKERLRKLKPLFYYRKMTEVHVEQCMQGGFLTEIDKFDPMYFRITPNEAKMMEPEQRLFLETAIEVIEDAGELKENLYNSKTGVYVGIDHTHKYVASYIQMIPNKDLLSMVGSYSSILSSRLSYVLNLTGPSIVIDTSCSSAMVALNMAVKALRREECTSAIVGGINIIILPQKNSMFDEIDTKNGQVRAFDSKATGTLWGEGVCAVFLKPLKQAIADNDHIYAVIKGVAANNNGASNGITAPSAKGQEQVLIDAWTDAGINPETIAYIETHGTGTILGDPIEIKGLTNAFGKFTKKKQFCGIGSVKTNIGHTVGASGLASLIKVLMAMKHKILPPSINFNSPNPLIDFIDSPVYMNNEPLKWDAAEYPRRAGISTYGFGGTNCHIILEEPPHLERTPETKEYQIFTLSAQTNELLEILIGKYNTLLAHNTNYRLCDMCYTVNTAREHKKARIALLVKNLDELKQKLNTVYSTGLSEIEKKSNIQDVHFNGIQQKQNGVSKNELEKASDTLINDIRESKLNGKKMYSTLCSYYIQGADIKWKKIYSEKNMKKVSLPSTPLASKSCWVEIPGWMEQAETGEEQLPNQENNKDRGNSERQTLNPKNPEEIRSYLLTAVFVITGIEKEQISLEDSWFSLGLDSLMALKLITRVTEVFKVDISGEKLYTTLSTIKAVSDYIFENIPEDLDVITI